ISLKSCVLLLVIVSTAALAVGQDTSTETVVIDSHAPAHPFPHFWEQMFGSGRAVLALRNDYQQDLRQVRDITGFRYVRFHGIFGHDVGLYTKDKQGHAHYNFSYVDNIYDSLLANHVRPFVELSFMPEDMAARNMPHPFWYHPNVSPPANWDEWGDLISTFAQHLIDRYGIDEVSQWYFEVWNEPNIDFWGGDPKQPTYFQLYDTAARALKQVTARLRIGGPATAQAAWADAFLKHCKDENVPVDFVSTHVYGNDTAPNVFGTNEDIPRNKMVCAAVHKVHNQIAASAYPKIPLIWSEFNASYKNEPDVTDATYMGPWLAETISQCDGAVDIMSYWTFSDVFEEQGVVKTPFYGGFGLIAERDIPKAAFNDFELLHQLGDKRLAVQSDSVIATRRDDGSLAIALWNYAAPSETAPVKTITLRFTGVPANASATISRVDSEHGDPLAAYDGMGKPAYPTMQQIEELRKAAQMPAPQTESLNQGSITLQIPSQGLVLLQVK
ncbi:MAG: GH39 family glycosyl hydrolase, partial [Terriglobales bacterium]